MLSVHRTTFFTEDAFDNHSQNDNPLLEDNDIDLINEYFNKEDEYQLMLINKNPNITIDDVNEYLKISQYVNIIGVTANLSTIDDMLVVCKRGKEVEDKETIYPSANGHAEFYDQNVSFYKESAYEDVPTLVASRESRIDFIGEISRETVAELNISEFRQKWQYIGISALAIKPTKDSVKRRFHFNILMKNTVNYNSKEVIMEHTKAIENYESEKNIYDKFEDL